MRPPADQRWSSLRSLALRPGRYSQVGMLYRYHEPSAAPMWGDAACRNGRHARCRRLSGHPALVAQRIEHLTTDQKVGGSSPSERAQVNGPYPLLGGAFFVPLGAMLGATAAGSGPNSAWFMDAATARRSLSTRCPY